MKQSLQLKLGQQLTMTPQLQQAIRLLQLSTLELQTEIQQALESNPMLEMEEESGAVGEGEASEPVLNEPVRADQENGEITLDENATLPDELPVDAAWDDVFEGPAGPMLGRGEDDEQRDFEQKGNGATLHDHLRWQLELSHLSERDMAIGTALIDSIDEDGYLTQPLEEIRAGFAPELEVELDEVEAVLRMVQNFDPAGVGARDLKECMSLQLDQFASETPWLAEAKLLVSRYMDLLAGRDFNQLMRRLKLTEEQLQEVIRVIQLTNPRPGGNVAEAQPEYVIPEVIVRKVKGQWRVELNPECAPRLRISPYYSSMVQRASGTPDNTYLKNQLQEARWFMKSLKSRNETLLKVAKCIVERQRAFFEYGEEAMKALVLHDVAEAVEMHESTISRVTTKKYMHTPRGIFELKYFFSSHVSTDGGGECSSTAIRALIKKMIAAENARRPLSDSKLASMLADQGIQVARRTVAKYREAMAIPPSNERKRLS
ncbi:MAG: RNA polymerase factor sigma-54 [Pseudomonadota bacterium]